MTNSSATNNPQPSDVEIAQEYDRLFGGVGKPEVYLYASHYLSGFLNEKPLARLRAVFGEAP